MYIEEILRNYKWEGRGSQKDTKCITHTSLTASGDEAVCTVSRANTWLWKRCSGKHFFTQISQNETLYHITHRKKRKTENLKELTQTLTCSNSI